MENNVQFDESQDANSFEDSHPAKTSFVTALFIKIGLAKDQKQANGVMLVLSIFCLLLMTYFLISTYFPNLLNFSKPKPSATQSSLQGRLDSLRNDTAPTSSQ
jgi:hypothetical protein